MDERRPDGNGSEPRSAAGTPACSTDVGRQLLQGPIELGRTVTACLVGFGQLRAGGRTGTMAKEAVGLDGEGQSPQGRCRRAGGISVLGLGRTGDRSLEGGGCPLDLEGDGGPQLGVVGGGVGRQEGAAGQLGVTEPGSDRSSPGRLAARDRRTTRSTVTSTMSRASTTMRTMRPHGVLFEVGAGAMRGLVVVVDACVVVVLCGALVVVVVGARVVVVGARVVVVGARVVVVVVVGGSVVVVVGPPLGERVNAQGRASRQ